MTTKTQDASEPESRDVGDQRFVRTAADWVSFNVNQTVRVKLTDHGRKVHRENFDAFWSQDHVKHLNMEYHAPKEDNSGWSSWQLWNLMKEFGEHQGMALPLCFETEIEFNRSS